MIVHLVATCWNEARILPFFFRYYDPLIDAYFIYDNLSDDGSLDILRAHPKVTVKTLRLPGKSYIDASYNQMNRIWWPSRGKADFVAVVNIDEFFWHRDLPAYLADCRQRGITFTTSTGYQMVSGSFPAKDAELTQTIRYGVPERMFNKPAFFNPDAITNSGFEIARHGANPEGNVVRPQKEEILLLHYKHLGIDYVVGRHAELNARRRSLDLKMGLGFHYDPRLTLRDHAQMVAGQQEIVSAADAAAAHRAMEAWQASRTGASPGS